MNKNEGRSGKMGLRRILSLIMAFILTIGMVPAVNTKAEGALATDLFFSEYIEGGSSNKAIEIYNGTGATVDLSSYTVEIYTNGSATVGTSLALTGSIPNGEVYVICNSSAVAGILAVADISGSAVANFNGDDALKLNKLGTTIDLFGVVGVDPGAAWTEGSYSTVDKTLVRKSLIKNGNTTFSFSEWDQYDKDTIIYLGSHTMDGVVSNNVAPVIPNPTSGSILYGNTDISLSCDTVGSTIYYRYNETDEWSTYADKITLTATGSSTVTIYVKSELDGKTPSTATLNYTMLNESNLVSIEAARAAANATKLLVKGVVTHIDGKNIVIQDTTGGILMYFVVAPSVNLGDEIIAYGTRGAYSGVEQLSSSLLLGTVSSSTLPEPIVVSLADAITNAESFESKRIKVENVIVGEKVVDNTLVTDTLGNSLNIYKLPALTGINKGDTVNIVAVMSQKDANYQLRVAAASDVIFVSRPSVAEIKATPNGGEVLVSDTISLACETAGATIMYRLNGTGEFIVYTSSFSFTQATTVEAYATKDGIDGIMNTFSFTIGDGKTDLAEARALFVSKGKGTAVTTTGIVTFIDGSNVYIQDSTGGIDIYFKNGLVTSKPSDVVVGKEVTVSGVFDEYAGLLEITAITSITVGETKELPTPKLINLDTLTDAQLEALESQRVLIKAATLGTIDTSKNTPVTTLGGKAINVYKIPALPAITAGSMVDVIAILAQNNAYQLRVAKASDVTLAKDEYAPVIKTDNITDPKVGEDYRVLAVVTDGTGIESVMLTYTVEGSTPKTVTMTNSGAGLYSYTVSAAELTGSTINLVVTATDTMETSNTSNITVIKNIIDLPRIINVSPTNGSSTGEGTNANKPAIIANFENAGVSPTVVMKLDSVTVDATISAVGEIHKAEFNTPSVLTDGKHTVEITITRQDSKTMTYTWNFTVGTLDYNIYFGQIHAHTNLSDGSGEVEDAFSYAAKQAQNLDFLAITDHSNWLEDVAGTNHINDATNSTKWLRGKKAAADITAEVDGFVGIYAYEMTWSGGSIGHMNTFNTPGFENRNYADYKGTTALKNYYDALKTQTQSITMFNHPGDTFGDFGDFSLYDPTIDKLVTMIEVGNGEGPIRGTGYFPSYEYYTRALDKGWHVAPTNNQDNHKGKWGDSNTARTVAVTQSLTESSIYEAMTDMRIYATEDNNLSILYTLNNNIMGTIIDVPTDTVNIAVDIEDPDNEAIGNVEVIVNGGMVAASKVVTSSNEVVTFTLPANYSYYYIRITQADKDIAVTAPVWVGDVEKCGIAKSTVNTELVLKGEEVEITTSFYNNETLPLEVTKLVYSINGEIIQTVTGVEALASLTQSSATIKYTSPKAGKFNIDVKLYTTMDGQEKVYTDVVKITFNDPSIVTKVIVDGTHSNDYVYGYYSGNMVNFTKLAAKEMVQVKVVKDKITPEMLADAGLLVISAPAKSPGVNSDNKPYVAVHFSDEYIAMVKNYVDAGGNIIICGLSDLQDKADYQTSTELNKLLAAIGATTKINSDQATDFTTNGGQEYRLYLKGFNMESEFLEGVVPEQQYSIYKGSSISLDAAAVEAGKVEYLIKGYATTEVTDTTKFDTNFVPTEKGNVIVLASEKLAGGGFMLVGGSVFMSNFEVKAEMDNIWDLQYANYNIILNALKMSQKEIAITPIADARLGNLGDVFTIEGTVTAGTETGNAFFDTIYIQDSTGGMDIFPINEQGILNGQKVRVTGILEKYENDLELVVINASVIDTTINKVEPELVTTAQAANYLATGGKLIMVNGKITEIVKVEGVVSHFMVKDSSGTPIRVFVNGYIGSSTQVDHTTILEIGDQVTAVGLSSMDTEGVRIRVRDRAEIVNLNPEVQTSTPTTTTATPTPKQEVSLVNVGETSTLVVATNIDAKLINNKAQVNVDSSVISRAIAAALAEIAKLGDLNEKPLGEVELNVVAAANSGYIGAVETIIPTAALAAIVNSDVKTLKISTPIGDITLDKNTLQTLVSEGKNEVMLSIVKVEKNKLSAEVQEITKDRPVYELKITSGDKEISQFNGGKATISVPYELKVGEKPQNIIIYYINSKNELEVVNDTRYDVEKKQVTFTTTHFSHYTVAYELPNIKFMDVPASAWYKEAVYSLAELRISIGTSTNAYEPTKNVTRAEFIMMLAKLSGADLSKYNKAHFSDVSPTAWYANAANWAMANGVAQGNNGKFSPTSAITREEMAVMIANYMVNVAKINLSNSNTSFTDEAIIASYAKVAVSQIRQAGIIAGKVNNTFAPKDTLTRAEAAQVISKLLK
jgi:hypothetical protein